MKNAAARNRHRVGEGGFSARFTQARGVGMVRKRKGARRKKQKLGRTVFLCLTLCGLWGVLGFSLWRELGKTGRAMEQYTAPVQEESVLLDVPFIDQRGRFPTGCEGVTATMALQYAGVDVTPEEVLEAIPRGAAPHPDGAGGYIGCDPREAFPGNPYSEEGWGCYAPVVEKAAEDILRERDETSLSIINLTDTPLPELCQRCLRQGVPVLVWATIDMETPVPGIVFTIEGTGEEFQWIYPLHCLLLVGEDESSYYFNDPMAGKAVAYGKWETEQAYEALGRQALAIYS